tara:strand:+ start:389 stop:736 length:348 start_codon:yes stop_codon:yes gene_type:complete
MKKEPKRINIEEIYPKTCQSFEFITDEMFELFKKKQEDYGPTNIGMGSRTVDNDDDVERSMIGLAIRLNDKIQRLMNLTFKNIKKPNNESIEDTLIDIANYAVMAKIVLNKDWGK